MGTAAAEAEAAAISQQREVGGDPGSGRFQDGGVPRAAASGELCADDHEHGEVATVFTGVARVTEEGTLQWDIKGYG